MIYLSQVGGKGSLCDCPVRYAPHNNERRELNVLKPCLTIQT